MTDLDRIILNFLNENKLYPTNMVNTLTKKLGDSSDETLNKIAIFGLFREQPPFKSIKDINQLNSLDELTELFNKWKEYAVKGLMDADGELKGNKTATLAFLDAYINNIRSLKDNAKPFSFKGYEQSLIDVVNKNEWIKSNDVETQTYGVEKPYDNDIIFEDDNIIILKGSNKAKCITYGQGYRWCISQTQHNMYNHYRITNGATIYFVLNKKLPKDDKERVCVILRYYNNKYSIADATNSGKRSGGPEVAGDGFNYVEGELPWLRGMEKYFPESEVTQSEKDYEAAVSISYYGDDLGNYVINKSKELNFNGEEVDPVDFLRDYLVGKLIYDKQFASLTEAMKVQVIEMGSTLLDSIIINLSSALKVRHAIIRLGNGFGVNLGLYSDEEKDRVINNLKDKLFGDVISNIIYNIPYDNKYKYVLKILDLIKDNLNNSSIARLLINTPTDMSYDLVLRIFPLIKDKLDKENIFKLLSFTPDDKQYELILQILPLVKDKLNDDIINTLLNFTPEEKRFNQDKVKPGLINQILILFKDKLNEYIIDDLIRVTPQEQRYNLILEIFPLVKDNLDDTIIPYLLSYTPEEKRYNFILQILELVKDNLDDNIINILLEFTPLKYIKYIETLINKYQQKDIVNELRLMVRKILKENY